MGYAITALICCIPAAYWIGRRRAIRECENWLKRYDLINQEAKNLAYISKVKSR